MCPSKLLARISELTPSSQAKKSLFEVRSGICVTVGSVFEAEERTGDVGTETGTGGI
jgi:hypothetical protein